MYNHTLLFIACMLSASHAKDLLIVMNYQKDFLIGGAMGKKDEGSNLVQQKTATSRIIDLIEAFKHDHVASVIYDRPENHISFLSRHIKENQGNAEILTYLGETFDPNDIKSVEIIYDKASLEEGANPKDVVKRMSYLEKDIPYDSATEVKAMNYLFPDNCIEDTEGNKIPNIVDETFDYVSRNGSGDVADDFIGTSENIESLSLIYNSVGQLNTNFIDNLTCDRITRVYLTGAFMEYTILNTALDLLNYDSTLEIFIIEDASISFLEKDAVIQNIKSQHQMIKFIDADQILQKKVRYTGNDRRNRRNRRRRRRRLQARTSRRLL